DDRLRDHGGAAADHVEPWHRRGGDAADRGSDDRRHGVVDIADAHCHSRDLCGREGRVHPVAASDSRAPADMSMGGIAVYAKGAMSLICHEAGAPAAGWGTPAAPAA